MKNNIQIFKDVFQNWICDEVIPSIRKHGIYATDVTIEKLLADPDFAIQALQNLKEERQKRIEAEQKVAEASNSSCLIGELAKLIAQNGYPIGEKRLFAWMREKGYLGKHGERYNIPNQQYIEQGLFEIKKGVRSGSGGVLHTTITSKVTGKGQVYFVNKFLNSHIHS
jgi:anti-repressor protein